MINQFFLFILDCLLSGCSRSENVVAEFFLTTLVMWNVQGLKDPLRQRSLQSYLEQVLVKMIIMILIIIITIVN